MTRAVSRRRHCCYRGAPDDHAATTCQFSWIPVAFLATSPNGGLATSTQFDQNTLCKSIQSWCSCRIRAQRARTIVDQHCDIFFSSCLAMAGESHIVWALSSSAGCPTTCGRRRCSRTDACGRSATLRLIADLSHVAVQPRRVSGTWERPATMMVRNMQQPHHVELNNRVDLVAESRLVNLRSLELLMCRAWKALLHVCMLSNGAACIACCSECITAGLSWESQSLHIADTIKLSLLLIADTTIRVEGDDKAGIEAIQAGDADAEKVHLSASTIAPMQAAPADKMLMLTAVASRKIFHWLNLVRHDATHCSRYALRRDVCDVCRSCGTHVCCTVRKFAMCIQVNAQVEADDKDFDASNPDPEPKEDEIPVEEQTDE